VSVFDRYSEQYKAILDASLSGSRTGADSKFFADYKARYTARFAGAGFAGKVLDFGCGIGLVSDSLKKCLPEARIHGFDESQGSIRQISSDLRAQGTFTCDSKELETDYDLIVVANVLHHVPPEARRTLCGELYSRLNHAGRLLVFEHNPRNPFTVWVVNHCPFDEDAVLLLPTEILAYLRDAGFHSLAHRYIMFFPRPLALGRRLEPLLGWCPLGAQYAVEACKGSEGSGYDAIR